MPRPHLRGAEPFANFMIANEDTVSKLPLVQKNQNTVVCVIRYG